MLLPSLVGSRRLENGSWSVEGVSAQLPFRVALNEFAAFEVWQHFGRYGVDLYFDSDGLPVLLETPTGEIVMRGSKQWQYWKFVWRSSLVTGITLVDHLHMTHFRISNFFGRVSRVALSANSPLRRVMSIFTFGGIFVNMQAMHTLIGPSHLLHRASPFKAFTHLSKVVPAGTKDPQDVNACCTQG